MSDRYHRRHDVHVFRDAESRGWVVAVGGRHLSRHKTQRVALAAGASAARRHHVELVNHGRNGRIRTKDSLGPESPRRDQQH